MRIGDPIGYDCRGGRRRRFAVSVVAAVLLTGRCRWLTVEEYCLDRLAADNVIVDAG